MLLDQPLAASFTLDRYPDGKPKRTRDGKFRFKMVLKVAGESEYSGLEFGEIAGFRYDTMLGTMEWPSVRLDRGGVITIAKLDRMVVKELAKLLDEVAKNGAS